MSNFNSVLYQILGSRIKKRREDLQISQEELGKKAEIGRPSISNIEKGRQKPPLSVIYKICSHLDIDVHYIMPTFNEIEEAVKTEDNKSTLQTYIEESDLDENIKKEIDSLFNKKTDDI